MIFLPVIYILIVGLALVSLFAREIEGISFRFSLAWGAGAAFFMLLSIFIVLITPVFYSFATVIISSAITFYCLFLVFRIRTSLNYWPWLIFCLCGLFLFSIAFAVGSQHPYGEWDSWSLWQVRAKFLFEAPERWQNTLTTHYQADHPWFLPFLTIWAWAVSGTETFTVPFYWGIFTSIAMVLLLFGGMGGRDIWAWLAAGCLTVQPEFWWFGTTQYADVLVAYYILAAGGLFFSFDTDKRPILTACSIGLFLGSAAFLKIDGMLAAFIFTTGIFLYSICQGLLRSLLLPVGIGLFCFLPLISLSWIGRVGPSNSYPLDLSKFMDLSRWQIAASYFLLVFNSWGEFILFLIAVFFSLIFVFKKRAGKEVVLLGIIGCYILGILFFFIGTPFPLEWSLQVSVNRLLFEIRPLLVLVTFYILRKFHHQYQNFVY